MPTTERHRISTVTVLDGNVRKSCPQSCTSSVRGVTQKGVNDCVDERRSMSKDVGAEITGVLGQADDGLGIGSTEPSGKLISQKPVARFRGCIALKATARES